MIPVRVDILSKLGDSELYLNLYLKRIFVPCGQVVNTTSTYRQLLSQYSELLGKTALPAVTEQHCHSFRVLFTVF